MTGTNHAIFGSLIAAINPDPVFAIPAALASHFVLDSLPHYGAGDISKIFKILRIDIAVAGLFFAGIIIAQPAHWPLIVLCGMVAMSPDLMWAPNAFRELHKHPKKDGNAIMWFHGMVQWGERSWGMLIEVPWTLITLTIFILVLRSKH